MSEQNLTIEIEQTFKWGRLEVYANRQHQEVQIEQRYTDEKPDNITLTFNEAYRLMELIKAAIEVKI